MGVQARCQQGTEEPRGELRGVAVQSYRNQPSTSIRKEPKGRVRVVGQAKTQEPSPGVRKGPRGRMRWRNKSGGVGAEWDRRGRTKGPSTCCGTRAKRTRESRVQPGRVLPPH